MTEKQADALIEALVRMSALNAAGLFAIAGSGWTILSLFMLVMLFVTGKVSSDKILKPEQQK